MKCTTEDCEGEPLPEVIGDKIIGFSCPVCGAEYTARGVRA
jgi:predicted RNA-binding Zn-ribbon protein involved in translation (DUF1610 family)